MSAAGIALGEFLRSRRDALTPQQAGIAPFPGMRRVPGLRREELAVLAGISADHYSRIEQGRQPSLTDDVITALARALRLDDTEYAHLRDLSRSGAPAERSSPGRQVADAGLLRVLRTLDVPGVLLGRRGTILARNPLFAAVLGAPMHPGQAFPRWLFLDPDARTRIVNWSDFAAAAVGSLRYETGRYPDDAQLTALLSDLRSADPSVAHWWDQRGVTNRTSVIKQIAHPDLGPLEFTVEAFGRTHDPDQSLVVYTVEPESNTARQLPRLTPAGPSPVAH